MSGGVFSKILSFQPQGPQFKPQLCWDLNICVTFVPAKSILTVYPYKVDKLGANPAMN